MTQQDDRSTEKGSLGPAAMIFAAWIAGTLLFEISALENVRSSTAGEHWGTRASTLGTWTVQRTEVVAPRYAVRTPDQVAKQVSDQYQLEVNRTGGHAQTGLGVVKASIGGNQADRSKVRLSSHESEVQPLGLQLPRMDLPSLSGSDEGQSASEQE